MTPTQKRLKELRDRQSRERGRMAELSRVETLDDEQRAEMDRIETGTPDLERQLRAAQAAVDQEQEGETRTAEPDAEARERLELRSRASVTNFLLAAAGGRQVTGAEAELQQAAGVTGIPIEIFDVPEQRETRADAATTAPGTTGINFDPIRPMIYARSILPRIGVAMPRIGSGSFATATISTGLTAGAKAAGAAQESTAAMFNVQTTTPKRISARLSIRIEDVAAVGTANYEAALRQNLQLVMAQAVDLQGLTGNGTAPNLSGIMTALTAAKDPTDVITWAAFVEAVAGGIDGGPWSESLKDVKLVVNAAVMRKAETTFQAGGTGSTDTPGEMSVASYLRGNSGGFYASSRMPAAASNIAKCIRHRAGTMGLNGVNAMRTAVMPVYSDLGIDDIFSDSASGIRHYTLHHLCGDVLIEQPSAYEEVRIKLA